MRLPKQVKNTDQFEENHNTRQYTLRENDQNIKEIVYVIIPKDGGFGYIIAVISFINFAIIDGILCSFGPILTELVAYYPEKSLAELSLLNSLTGALYYLFSPISSGIVNRWGFRVCTLFGSVISSTGYLISYFYCDYYFVLLICYGILPGIGLSLINLASGLIINFYFEKLRTIVMSIVTCGTSCGIIFFGYFTIITNKIIGWENTVLFHGGMLSLIYFISALFIPPEYIKIKKINKNYTILKDNASINNTKWYRKLLRLHKPELHPLYRDDAFLTTSSSGLMKDRDVPINQTIHFREKDGTKYSIIFTRNPQANNKLVKIGQSFTRAVRNMLDFRLLLCHSFKLYCLSGFLTLVSLYVPYIFIYARNIKKGMDPQLCQYLVPTLGFSNLVGRLLTGFIASFFSPLTVMAIQLSIAGLALSISMISYSPIFQFSFCTVYGYSTCVLSSLKAITIVELYGLQKLTNAFGIALLFQGIGLFISSPLCGFLISTFSYDVGFFVAGLLMLISGLILLPIKAITKHEDKITSLPE